MFRSTLATAFEPRPLSVIGNTLPGSSFLFKNPLLGELAVVCLVLLSYCCQASVLFFGEAPKRVQVHDRPFGKARARSLPVISGDHQVSPSIG